MPNETVDTTIKLNEYITLVVKTPTTTDIATYDGIAMIVRRISKAVGTILPTTRKKYQRSNSKWNEESAKEFVNFYYKNGSEETAKKYNLPHSKTASQTKYVLVNKFNLKNQILKRGPSKAR